MEKAEARKRIIATDEAGYGPMLGPLVIGATSWTVSTDVDLIAAFAASKQGLEIESLGRVRLDDSKSLFSPGKAGGLAALEIAMLASVACIANQTPSDLTGWLDFLSAGTSQRLAKSAWFEDLHERFPVDLATPTDWPAVVAAMKDVWSTEQLELQAISATVVSAAEFNALCDQAGNKATVLSEQTVRLAAACITADDEEVEVFSDKHGGRAYYAGLLQHFFPDDQLSIECEGREKSCYRMHSPRRSIRWHFTAKGDRFAPVALASMIAKYSRERLMGVFNSFWQARLPELKPTAGYPSDARRYIAAIADVAKKEGFTERSLVRQR